MPGCNCQYLSLSFMQPRAYVSWGRCDSSECVSFFLPRNLIFPPPQEIFVKQDGSLRKMDAIIYGFWLFFSRGNSFCICLKIRRIKYTKKLGHGGRSDWVCRQWYMTKWNCFSFRWTHPGSKYLSIIVQRDATISSLFIYCKVTLHVSGVVAPIIRST